MTTGRRIPKAVDGRMQVVFVDGQVTLALVERVEVGKGGPHAGLETVCLDRRIAASQRESANAGGDDRDQPPHRTATSRRTNTKAPTRRNTAVRATLLIVPIQIGLV